MPTPADPPPRRRQATPIELAAILMEAVCGPSAGGDDAVAELSAFLELPADRLQGELMFLRAFAVEFAATMALGDSEERAAIGTQYYRHWEQVAGEAGGDLLADLDQRLRYYGQAVVDETASAGLGAQVGAAFASLCGIEEGGPEEVAVLGASMFAALFDEVCDLLTSIDIVLLD